MLLDIANVSGSDVSAYDSRRPSYLCPVVATLYLPRLDER